ncbi:hypothetical protein TNCV_3163971 [Trichonephila clavipes]|nr:hypothetical protein TNCV_3163971 [Trichonephila clavipes]
MIVYRPCMVKRLGLFKWLVADVACFVKDEEEDVKNEDDDKNVSMQIIEEVEIEVVSPSIVPSGNFTELNRTVTCMVLKVNDRRTSSPMP